MREIRTITFSAAVQSQVFASTYFRKEMTDLWRESVITALFAQEVARLKRRNVESAYLCGLLHRVGHAVVLARVGSAAVKNRLTPDAAQILPFAHKHEARVGALLAACWNLPPAVSAAMRARWAPAELPATTIGTPAGIPCSGPAVRTQWMSRLMSTRCCGNPASGVADRW